jgi:hypothetical protein
MKILAASLFLSPLILQASPETMAALAAYQQSQLELLYIETAVDQAVAGHARVLSPFPVAKSIMQGAISGFGVFSTIYGPLKQAIS